MISEERLPRKQGQSCVSVLVAHIQILTPSILPDSLERVLGLVGRAVQGAQPRRQPRSSASDPFPAPPPGSLAAGVAPDGASSLLVETLPVFVHRLEGMRAEDGLGADPAKLRV